MLFLHKMKSRFKDLLFSWRSIPLSKKLFLLVGSMIFLIILELIILSFAMTNLSAVRVYVAGEGEWSKAQKNAFFTFERFIKNKSPKTYNEIFQSLSVIDGDHAAKMELNNRNPDLKKIREGFLQGHVHPADLDTAIYFFRKFQRLKYVKVAVYNWSKGDEIIAEFKWLVEKYHSDLLRNQLTPTFEKTILERIQNLNRQASLYEHEFTQILSEGSRWMEKQIFNVLFLLVFTVSVFGIALTALISRYMTKRLYDLNSLATEYGLGNFERQLHIDGGDEIGQLTSSINRMGSLLSCTYQQILESHQDLERKVQERTAELKRALSTRDEFLSIANHEMRTPLTAIVLQLRILERAIEKCPENPEMLSVRDSLKKTHRLVKKLVDLQNALMDVTHIQLGKFQIKTEKCDFSRIAAESLAQLSFDASRSGVRIDASLSENLDGKFDPVRSCQVVTNLVSNAIKYGEGRPVELDLTHDKGKVILMVTDYGPGIPFEKMDTIFDRFQRGDHDKSFSGLGLGLYITKQIVEAHGGSLFVNNVRGKGARFTAEFPLLNEKPLYQAL